MTLETVDLEITLIVMKKHKWAEEKGGALDGRNDLSKGIEKTISTPGQKSNNNSKLL